MKIPNDVTTINRKTNWVLSLLTFWSHSSSMFSNSATTAADSLSSWSSKEKIKEIWMHIFNNGIEVSHDLILAIRYLHDKNSALSAVTMNFVTDVGIPGHGNLILILNISALSFSFLEHQWNSSRHFKILQEERKNRITRVLIIPATTSSMLSLYVVLLGSKDKRIWHLFLVPISHLHRWIY